MENGHRKRAFFVLIGEEIAAVLRSAERLATKSIIFHLKFHDF